MMQGKTKGFFEDTGIILVLVASIYGVYYLYNDISDDSVVISESVHIETKVIDEVIINDKSFFEKNFNIAKNILENMFPLYKQEDIKESEIIKEEITLAVKEIEENKEIIEEIPIEITKEKSKETIEEIPIEIGKEESKEIIEETPLLIKSIEVVKKEKTIDIDILRTFLRKLKFDIASNIEKYEDKTNKESQKLKIRITVLKDGSYEELIFVGGNKKLFDTNKENILKVFPLSISESIQDEFPRYVRISIK